MRKYLALLVAPAMLFGTVAAADASFEPCGSDLEHPVLAAGDTLSEAPSGEESFSFFVDPTTAEKGRMSVDAVLTWENSLNDWDLGINDVVTEGFQPIDEAVESASYSARGNCTLVTVSVIDYSAMLPELGMSLEISVR